MANEEKKPERSAAPSGGRCRVTPASAQSAALDRHQRGGARRAPSDRGGAGRRLRAPLLDCITGVTAFADAGKLSPAPTG